jgi:hypothetical protein
MATSWRLSLIIIKKEMELPSMADGISGSVGVIQPTPNYRKPNSLQGLY